MGAPPDTVLRPLKPEDLDRVVDIDRRLVGRWRRGFFEKRLAAAVRGADKVIAVAVEDGGSVNGYAIARIQLGAFGGVDPIAILDAIGIDPEHAREGVGRALLSQLLANLAALGVETVRTDVAWVNFCLLRFLHRRGFLPVQRLVFAKRVDWAPPNGAGQQNPSLSNTVTRLSTHAGRS